jgi:hypothetical protein
MPHDVEGIGIFVGEDFNPAGSLRGQGRVESNDLVVDFSSDGGLGESRANGLGDLEDRTGVGVGLFGSVGKLNDGHDARQSLLRFSCR